jgi:hypothetical protein
MRVAAELLRHARQVRWDKRGGLSGEATKRTLIGAMAGWRVLAGGFVVVDLDAELRRVAKDCPKLGGDRDVISACESGRSEPGRRAAAKS